MPGHTFICTKFCEIISNGIKVMPEINKGNNSAKNISGVGPGFDTRSGNILSFLLPLFQEGQLSVTGESMCTKYWLTA